MKMALLRVRCSGVNGMWWVAAVGLVVAGCAGGCGSQSTAKPAATTAARENDAGQAASGPANGATARRELPSLAEERARPVNAEGVKSAAGHELPSLADEKARATGAPIPLPEAAGTGLPATQGLPEWWLDKVQFEDGRYAACAQGEGVSFIGARQQALDDAVAKLKASGQPETPDLRTDRVHSTNAGGMFRVRVRVSCAAR